MNHRIKLLLLAALAIGFSASCANAQSSPGLVTGQVPTAAQWNSYFAGKQNYPVPAFTTTVNGSVPAPGAVSGNCLKDNGTWAACGGGTPANPTATIGAAAVNGVASTFMRSDAAPALPSTLPALDGSALTSLTAANLSGAVPVNKGGTACTAAAIGCVTAISGATGTPSATTFLRGDGTWSTPSGAAGANPTGTIGASAVNGVATTFMRSDATPALPSTLPALNGSLLTSLTLANISGAGTGSLTAIGVNVGTAGSMVVNGGALGTPSSGTLTSATGLPISTGVSGLGTSVASFLGTPSSANLRAALTDEVGTGAAYFVGGALGTPASVTLTNGTGLVASTGLTATGTKNSTTTLFGDDTWKAAGTGTVTSITGGTGIIPSTNPCVATCTLNLTSTNNAQTGTTYPTVSGDGGKIVSLSNASPVAVSLSQASTAGFTAGFALDYNSIGAGATTVTAATSVFDNGLSTLGLVKGQDAFVWSDSTNFHSMLSLPVMAQDTFLGNPNASNYPIAMAVPACANDGTHALVYASHALACATLSGGFSSPITIPVTDSQASAASTPAWKFTGAIFTGGSGTTNTPHVLIQPSSGVTAVTNWNTGGVEIGLVLPDASTGSFFQCIKTNVQICNLAGDGSFGVHSLSIDGGAPFVMINRLNLSSLSDGTALFQNYAGTGFTALQVGNATSSFPEWKVSGAGWVARLGDDSANTSIAAAGITGSSFALERSFASSTAPTIASGFGTSPAVTSHNGTKAFTITIGSSPGSTGTLTMPASPGTAWACKATDLTTHSTSVALTIQTGTANTTSVTLTQYSDVMVATAWVAADVIQVNCDSY